MGERYKILPNETADGWLIFDTVENRFLTAEFEREVQAEARVADIINVQRISESEEDDGVYGVEPDDLDLEAEMESEGNARELRGLQIVLDALAGKVVCSNCAEEYHGASPHAMGHVTYPRGKRPPVPTHSLKVTRYIGYDTPKLTVDLTCTICAHTGLYEFPGNPLIDAGIVEEIPF